MYLSNTRGMLVRYGRYLGVYILTYSMEILGAKIGAEVRRRAEQLIDTEDQKNREIISEEQNKAMRSFWGLRGESIVHLVCPEIPEEDRIKYANFNQRDYLRLAKFADIDTLYRLKSFLALHFPEVHCVECTSNELPLSAYTETLIVIGGIAWNKITVDMSNRIRIPWLLRDGGPGNDDPLEDTRTGKRYLQV